MHYLRLDSEVEEFTTIQANIEKDVVFKGTNLWILVFAIIIASVGLNMNSTAVIIGAMLISPLMGPINGIGYSIATYNFELLRKAIKNFSFAVGASLAASTAYFALSPVSTAHSELLARTSPTIYDVLIALFGGLAGIVAISSKQKGNVIPGVAIATALMPPLCTAGYGLATAQFQFFFGAFYLFTINTVFIALASLIVSQLLNFPIISVIGNARRKQVNRSISIIIAVTIIPSIYFGYNLVKQEKFNEQSTRFIKSIGVFEGNYLLDHETNPAKEEIKLVFGGNELSADDKAQLNKRLIDFSLNSAKLKIEQGFFTGKSDKSEAEKIRLEMNSLSDKLKIEAKVNDSLLKTQELGGVLLEELSAMFPAVTGCAYAETRDFSGNGEQSRHTALVRITTNDNSLSLQEKERIRNWLTKRTGTASVNVWFEKASE
ncbi:MAG: DUF389 domain-containing protein [Bacteroidota bacterium]